VLFGLCGRAFFGFELPQIKLVARRLCVRRAGHQLQVSLHVFDGIGVVAQLCGNQGGVEVALRPGGILRQASLVVVYRCIWMAILDGVFGSDALDAHRIR